MTVAAGGSEIDPISIPQKYMSRCLACGKNLIIRAVSELSKLSETRPIIDDSSAPTEPVSNGDETAMNMKGPSETRIPGAQSNETRGTFWIERGRIFMLASDNYVLMNHSDGPDGIGRRRLLRAISAGAAAGTAGCGILIAQSCQESRSYKVDGEPFTLSDFPDIELAPMEADSDLLVADFEVPSGDRVHLSKGGGDLVYKMEYGCYQPDKGRVCSCESLRLWIASYQTSYSQPLIPGERLPEWADAEPTDDTLAFGGEELSVWRITNDDWRDWEMSEGAVEDPSLELLVGLPYESADGERLYAETRVRTDINYDGSPKATTAPRRDPLEAGTWRILRTATPATEYDRSDVDVEPGRTPDGG